MAAMLLQRLLLRQWHHRQMSWGEEQEVALLLLALAAAPTGRHWHPASEHPSTVQRASPWAVAVPAPAQTI